MVGSGPGGLQTSYALAQAGVRHAALSADPAPGGLFRRFPLFQRLITWSKPQAPAERRTRAYGWYDWNSLIAEEPELRDLVVDAMDGTSYFPARAEMERGLVGFAEGAALPFRYGCRWESTGLEDGDVVLRTSDGEYRAPVALFAVGTTQPWTPPDIPGIELAPHYVDVGPAREYEGKRVFVIGKRNSGFEVADGLLATARQIILASPRPAKISVVTRSTAGARARYLQPYEDWVLGGGTFILDAAIQRVERTGGGYRVTVSGTTRPGQTVFDVDEVVVATGFTTPLGDLPDLGVATFRQGRLPALTPFWESASVPGIFFAGSVMQGSAGLKKHGVTSNSAAVHGFRFNAAIQARHIAATRFGRPPPRPPVAPVEVAGLLLADATRGPELWNQPSHLARAITFDPAGGPVDDGIVPLEHFVDAAGPDAVAMTVEQGPDGEIRPCAYVRSGGDIHEHVMASDPMLDFETAEHRRHLATLLDPLGT